MTMEKRPVCCTLGDAEQRARLVEIEATIARRITEARELADGYALSFRGNDPRIVEELGRFIAFERVCCAFLDFALRVPGGNGSICLELTGSAEAKAFLRPMIEAWAACSQS